MHFIGFRLSHFINWRSDVFDRCLQAEFVVVLWLPAVSEFVTSKQGINTLQG
jgi:hypothetical protein